MTRLSTRGASGPTASGPTANNPAGQDGASRLGPQLKEYLIGLLPEYLVPYAVMTLPSLPLTVNGKLKTDELPLPGVAAGTVAARTPAERTLTKIWSDTLNMTGVGIRDNFFDLGGNSLIATQIIARAHQAGLRISLKDLFQHQTIEELVAACHVAERGKDD